LLAGCCAAGLFGTVAAYALPEDSEQPIHMRADNAEGDLTGTTILTGDVRMDQGTMRVEGDTMTIEQEDDKVVRITTEGDLAHYTQQLHAGDAFVKADAEVIIYHAREEFVEFRGRAFLTQDNNEFRGHVIVYDMKAGKVDATSNEEDPVRMIWQPATKGD
jgi:lipopolysaccharide export system protein LptA